MALGPARLTFGKDHEVSDVPVGEGARAFYASGGPHGALVLHGFIGSPQSVRGLAEAFARAGFGVALPRLPGHGTSLEDMATTTWSDWSGAAEQAYRTLAERSDRVVVAGLSMGGALSLWLAARHPSIAGLVLVNPLVDASSLSAARQAATEALTAGEAFLPGIGNDVAKPGVTELGYDGAPAACVISALDAVAELASRLPEIRRPAILAHSPQDHVLPRASRELLEAIYGGPLEVLELERSFHVATLDYDAEMIERRAVEFALTVVAASPSAATSDL
jgi:carboxylesterase